MNNSNLTFTTNSSNKFLAQNAAKEVIDLITTLNFTTDKIDNSKTLEKDISTIILKNMVGLSQETYKYEKEHEILDSLLSPPTFPEK